ncbi:Vacuolar protein sorting-associated protein 13B [Liparis tanakae]|uniref:Vacuolar protein sorting-associated protein 13B n=1 Tax=Liparis tanakae TaxID=230148 RepID=A0A4Z2E422_9TELE|nr:Vacuolar protein sorting-associated protein 13B [Liparis tanakae]
MVLESSGGLGDDGNSSRRLHGLILRRLLGETTSDRCVFTCTVKTDSVLALWPCDRVGQSQGGIPVTGGVPPHRPVLEPLAQWDSPMQVKLSCWKPGLNTLLVELLPWALLANHSHWDLWLFEGETIVLQIPAGKVIVPPNFKVGVYLCPIKPSLTRKSQGSPSWNITTNKWVIHVTPQKPYFIF